LLIPLELHEAREPGIRGVRRRKQRAVGADLRQARAIGRHDRAAERHGLEWRKPEPFREGWKCQAKAVLQERRDLAVGQSPEPGNIAADRAGVAGGEYLPVERTDDRQLQADVCELIG
jgi:hypothetical protein